MRISDWSSDVCSSDLRKVFEIGVHSVWALRLVGGSKSAKGDWAGYHRSKSNNKDAAWEDFWARIAMIEKIGAIWYAAGIFDSEEPDAETLRSEESRVGYEWVSPWRSRGSPYHSK